jgi:polysaccharide export outer membrane protein
MRRSIVAGLIAASIAIRLAPAQDATSLASLIQYVRDARKSGLNDIQIQASAEKAGWNASAVAQAIRSAARPAAAPASIAQTAPEEGIPRTPAKPGGKTPPETSGATRPQVNSGVSGDYEIGPGDVVQISVWKEPDASIGNTVVRTDGKISLPLLKDFDIAGLTTTEAAKRITDQLSKFITAPDVTVIVSAINSKKVFVNGAVKKEGPIPFTYRMTVLQALSEAGGLTDYAKRKKIYVLHSENGREFKFDFDYDAVLKGQKLEQNIQLVPGDTIVVPH